MRPTTALAALADRHRGPRRAGGQVRVRDRRGPPARGPRPRAARGGTVDAKQLTELQHELETLQRRQSSLEDSLLEVMERREELQSEQAGELADDRRAADRAGRRRQPARDAALARSTSRDTGRLAASELAASLDAELVALYERQRHAAAPARSAAGPPLRGLPHRDRPRRAVAHRRGRRRRGAALPGVRRNPVAGQGRESGA